MREVYALLPEEVRCCTLMQVTMPKIEMLSRHRAAIDSGERSVRSLASLLRCRLPEGISP